MSAHLIYNRSSFMHLKIKIIYAILILAATICTSKSLHAKKPVLRKVLVFYNSKNNINQDNNLTFVLGQMPLNYYGILPEYKDVNQRPLPSDKEMEMYRGVITWFQSNDMVNPVEYYKWLLHQFDLNKKVVILGQTGGEKTEGYSEYVINPLIDKIYFKLGVSYQRNFTANKRYLRLHKKDTNRVEFERKYPYFVYDYEKYKPIRADVKSYVSLLRKDVKNSVSSVIITSNTLLLQ